MNIARRLASKSTAIMPHCMSEYTSQTSIALLPTLSKKQTDVIEGDLYKSGEVDTEPVRKPSNPANKQFFQDLYSRSQLPRDLSEVTFDRDKIRTRERDNASSFYSQRPDTAVSLRPPSTGVSTIRKPQNPNSLAMGGRAASQRISRSKSRAVSNQIPERRSSQGRTRSISASVADSRSKLDVASNIIRRYVDGASEVLFGLGPATSTMTEHWLSVPSGARAMKVPAREEPKDSSRYSGDRDIESNITPLAESATHLWNRAFIEHTGKPLRKDLLSTPSASLHVHRRSSTGTMRYDARPSVESPCPITARRPHSIDGFGQLGIATEPKQGVLSRAKRRLSFLQLGVDNIRKYSPPARVCKASDQPQYQQARSKVIRPYNRSLGLWAHFADSGRAERNGPAGSVDDVLTRDFIIEHSSPKLLSPKTPLGVKVSNAMIDATQNTLNLLSIKRSERLARRKTRSLSMVAKQPAKMHKRSTIFTRRLDRQSSSNKLRAYFNNNGHRSSISAGQPEEYPEHEIIPGQPGEGFLDQSRPRMQRDLFLTDGTQSLDDRRIRPRARSPLGSSSEDPTMNTPARSKERSKENESPAITAPISVSTSKRFFSGTSGTWESVRYANMSESKSHRRQVSSANSSIRSASTNMSKRKVGQGIAERMTLLGEAARKSIEVPVSSKKSIDTQ
ncbi:hypothetical protein LTR66_014936, partial [Elasticomyces elasticus]